jgi:hypothetical protein
MSNMAPTENLTYASDLRAHLQLLRSERALARVEGLDANQHYMADLDDEIATTTGAYVGAAVTEIAALRGELTGRLHG